MEPKETQRNQTFKTWISSMSTERTKYNFNNMYLVLQKCGKEREFRRCVQQLTRRWFVSLHPLTSQQLQPYLRRSSVASSAASESDLEHWEGVDECGGDVLPGPSGRHASTADGYRSDGSTFESAEKGLEEALKMSELEAPLEDRNRCNRLNSCSNSSDDDNLFFIEKEMPSRKQDEVVLDCKEDTQLTSSNDGGINIAQRLNVINAQNVDNFETSDDIRMKLTGKDDSDSNSGIIKPNVDSTSDRLEKHIRVESTSLISEFESKNNNAVITSNVEEEGVEKDNQTLPMTSTASENLLNDVGIMNTKKYPLHSEQNEESTLNQIPVLILNNENCQSLVPSQDNSQNNKHSEPSDKAESKHELNLHELASAPRLTTESTNIDSQKDSTSSKCLKMDLTNAKKSTIATSEPQISKSPLKQAIINNKKIPSKSKCKKSNLIICREGIFTDAEVQLMSSWWNRYKNTTPKDKISAYYYYPLDNFGSEESYTCSILSETTVHDSITKLFDCVVEILLDQVVGVKDTRKKVYPSATIELDYERIEDGTDLQHSNIPTLKFLTKYKLYHLLLPVIQELFHFQINNSSSKLSNLTKNQLLSTFLSRLSSHQSPTNMGLNSSPLKKPLSAMLPTSGVINVNSFKPNTPLRPVLLPPPPMGSSPRPTLQLLDSPKETRFSCRPCILPIPLRFPYPPPPFSPLMSSAQLPCSRPSPSHNIMQVQALLPPPPLPPLLPTPPLPPLLPTPPLPPLPTSPPPQSPKQVPKFPPFLSPPQSPPLSSTPSSPLPLLLVKSSLESVNSSSSTCYMPVPVPLIKLNKEPKPRLTMPPHRPILSTLPDKTKSQAVNSSLPSTHRQPPPPTQKESSVPQCSPQLCPTNSEHESRSTLKSSQKTKTNNKSNVCNETAAELPDGSEQLADWHLTKCSTSTCVYIRNSVPIKRCLVRCSQRRNCVSSNTTTDTSQTTSYLPVSNEVRDPRMSLATWREPEQSSRFRITPALHYTEEALTDKSHSIEKQASLPPHKFAKTDVKNTECNEIKELPKETSLPEDKMENDECEERNANECVSRANKAGDASDEILLTNQVSINCTNENKEDAMKRKSPPSQINLNIQHCNDFADGNTDNNSHVSHSGETVIETALEENCKIRDANDVISTGADIEPPLTFSNKGVRDDNVLNTRTKEDNKERKECPLNSVENFKENNGCVIKPNREVNSDLPSSNASTTVGSNLGNCCESKENINHPVVSTDFQPEVNDKNCPNREVDSAIITDFVEEAIPGEPVEFNYTEDEKNMLMSFEPLLEHFENATKMCGSAIESHLNRKHGDVGTQEIESNVSKDSSVMLDLHMSSTEDESDDEDGHVRPRIINGFGIPFVIPDRPKVTNVDENRSFVETIKEEEDFIKTCSSDHEKSKSRPVKNEPVKSGSHVIKRAGKPIHDQTISNKIRSKDETKSNKSVRNTSLGKGNGSVSKPSRLNEQKQQSHHLVTLVEDQTKETSPSKSEQNGMKNIQEKQYCNTSKIMSNCINDVPSTTSKLRENIKKRKYEQSEDSKITNECEVDKLEQSETVTAKKSFQKFDKHKKQKTKSECNNVNKSQSGNKTIKGKSYVPSPLKLKFKNEVENVITINKTASKCSNKSSNSTSSQVSSSSLKRKKPEKNIRKGSGQIRNCSISVRSKELSHSESSITNNVNSCSIPSIQSIRMEPQELSTINVSVGSENLHKNNKNITNENDFQSRTNVSRDWDTDLRAKLHNNISTKEERSDKPVKKRKIIKNQEEKRPRKLKNQNDTVVSTSKLIKKNKDKRKKLTNNKSSDESKVEEMFCPCHSHSETSHSLPSMPLIGNEGPRTSDVLSEFGNLHHSPKSTTICKSKSLNEQRILVSIPKCAINEDILKNTLLLIKGKDNNKGIVDSKIVNPNLIPSMDGLQKELTFGKSTSGDDTETETSKGVKRSLPFDENGGKKICQVINEPSVKRKPVVTIEDEFKLKTSATADTLKRKRTAIRSHSLSEKQCTNLSKRQRSSSEPITSHHDAVNLQENSELVEIRQPDIPVEDTNSSGNSSIDSVHPLIIKPSDSTAAITVLNYVNQQIEITPIQNLNSRSQNDDLEQILTVHPLPSPKLIKDLNNCQRLNKSLSLDEEHKQAPCPQRSLSESATTLNLTFAEPFNLNLDVLNTNEYDNAILKESHSTTQVSQKKLNLSRQSEEVVASATSVELDCSTRSLDLISDSIIQSPTNLLEHSSNLPTGNGVNSTGDMSDNSTGKEATIRVKPPSLLCLTNEDNSRNLQTSTTHTWYRTPEQFDARLDSEFQNEPSTSTNTADENSCKNNLATLFKDVDASYIMKDFVNSHHMRLQFQKLIETGMLEGKNEFEKLCDIIECITLDCVVRDNYIAQIKKLKTQESQEEEVKRAREEFERNSLVRKGKFCNTFADFIKFFKYENNMKYPVFITIYFFLSQKAIATSAKDIGLKEYLLNILKKWVNDHESEGAFQRNSAFFQTDYDIICKMFDKNNSVMLIISQTMDTSPIAVNTVAAAKSNLFDFDFGPYVEQLKVANESEESRISGERSEYVTGQLNSVESTNHKNVTAEVIEQRVQTNRPIEPIQRNGQIANNSYNSEPTMPNMERTPPNVFGRQTSLQPSHVRHDAHDHNIDNTANRRASVDSRQITFSAPGYPVSTYSRLDNPHYSQPTNFQQFSRPSVLTYGITVHDSHNNFNNRRPNIFNSVTGQTNFAEIGNSTNFRRREPQENMQPAVPQQIHQQRPVTNNLIYVTPINITTNNETSAEPRSSNIGPELQHEFANCNTNMNFMPQHQVQCCFPGQPLYQQAIPQHQNHFNRPSQNLQETNRNQFVNQCNYSALREGNHVVPVSKSQKTIRRQTSNKSTSGHTQVIVPSNSTSNLSTISGPLQQMTNFTKDFQSINPLRRQTRFRPNKKFRTQSPLPRIAQAPRRFYANNSLRTVNQYQQNVYQPSPNVINVANMQTQNQVFESQRRNSQPELNSTLQPCSSNVPIHPNVPEPQRNCTQTSNKNLGQTQQIQTVAIPEKPSITDRREECYNQQTRPNPQSGEVCDYIDLTDEIGSLTKADIETLCSILSDDHEFMALLNRSEFENISEYFLKNSGSDQSDKMTNQMCDIWGDPTIYQKGSGLNSSCLGIGEPPIPTKTQPPKQQESALQNVPSVSLISDKTTSNSTQSLQKPGNITSAISSALVEIGHMREVLSKSQMPYHNFGGKQLTSKQATEFLDLLENKIKLFEVIDGLETYFVGNYIMTCGRLFTQCELQELAKYFVTLIRKKLEKKTGSQAEGEGSHGDSTNTQIDKGFYIDLIKRYIVKSFENGFDVYGHLLNLAEASGEKNQVAREIQKAFLEMIQQKRRKL